MHLLLLFTHADRQSVDISVTVCLFWCVCVCLIVQLRISPARIKLAVSNFAQLFMGVMGRKSPTLGNLAPPKPQIRRIGARRQVLPIDASPVHWRRARVARPGTPSACVDIRSSPKTGVLFLLLIIIIIRPHHIVCLLVTFVNHAKTA